MNTAAFTAYYEGDANANKLWSPGATGVQLTEVCVPRLLALPHFLTDFILETGHCLPHMLRKQIAEHIDWDDSQLPQDNWQLLLDWCLMAAQTNTNSNSLLHLSTMEPALSQDTEFTEWCCHRLEMSLGTADTVLMGQGRTPGENATRDLHMVERITSQMGRSLIAGVQALAPTLAGAPRGGGYDVEAQGNSMGENGTQRTMLPRSRVSVVWLMWGASRSFGTDFSIRRKFPPTATMFGQQWKNGRGRMGLRLIRLHFSRSRQ